VGGDLRRSATGLCRVVLVALGGADLMTPYLISHEAEK
jgi:hypothetical protein